VAEIDTQVDDDLPDLPCRRDLIGQALLNLVVNAAHAIAETLSEGVRDKGLIRITATRFGDRHIDLSVADDGPGIPPDIRERIFEPFFTTKASGRGTGLGLSVVHGIVTQNGGTIDVESRVGVGTTFRIAFPAVYEGTSPGERTTAGAGARGGERILLVEDDEAVRRVAARALRKANYDVLLASDGIEALQLISDDTLGVSAIITDVVMPRMGGGDLAEGVRAIFPEARILFTSGYTNDALSRNGFVESGVSFLQKPYAVEDLLVATRRLLDRG
jgi:CheY-like chemotaxis protein